MTLHSGNNAVANLKLIPIDKESNIDSSAGSVRQ